jgi:hypothetical protein
MSRQKGYPPVVNLTQPAWTLEEVAALLDYSLQRPKAVPTKRTATQRM